MVVASIKGKYGKSDYVDGWKRTHPSNGHYIVHHRKLNKKRDMFDNDGVYYFVELDDDSCLEGCVGINKERYKFSDFDNSDVFKDGNNH